MSLSTAVQPSTLARVVGIKTEFKNLRGVQGALLPQRIAVIGQGATASTYSTTKAQYSRSQAVGEAYGYGSPLHLAAQQLFPENGDGVGTIPVTFYPLDDDGSGVASTGDIGVSGAQTETQSYVIKVNEISSEPFTITVGDTLAAIVTSMAAAVNAVLSMPVTAVADTTPAAEKVDFTSKWKGTSANDVFLEVVGTVAGTIFAVTQPTGGLVNPDVQTALDQIGDIWETMSLSCFEVADTGTLDKYSAFGEGRWGATTHKPMVFFTGNAATSVASATAVSDARKTDRTNAQLVAPGSKNLPLVIAARQLARIALLADSVPAHDYGSLKATGLTPGLDGDQWLLAERDEALKKGSSSIKVVDGVINLADTVTFYHPTGEDTPAYRYVVDIIKLQNLIYNVAIAFDASWDGAPLIPDDQPTTNPAARTPGMAVARVAQVIDGLALEAILSDPDTIKDSIQAEIDSGNPKRLNVTFTAILSGNTNIISIDQFFGFFFGS